MINSNSISAVDGRIKDLSKKIEEINAMSLEIKNSQIKTIDYFEKIEKNKDNKNSFNEIKCLISEVQKELVGIRQKIDTKVEIKLEPKIDIIEPNLPILDKALTPSKKMNILEEYIQRQNLQNLSVVHHCYNTFAIAKPSVITTSNTYLYISISWNNRTKSRVIILLNLNILKNTISNIEFY